MRNTNKKRGGIGGFWDTMAPEQPPAPANEVPPTDEAAPTNDPTPVRQTPARPRRQMAPPTPAPATAPSPSAPAAPPRGPGRPRNEEPKARTTVNMSPRSWRLLEALRYRARMQGQRSTTYADLLDEAIALLAEQRNITLDE